MDVYPVLREKGGQTSYDIHGRRAKWDTKHLNERSEARADPITRSQGR